MLTKQYKVYYALSVIVNHKNFYIGKDLMKIYETPIRFFTEPTNESDMQAFLKYLHIYVTNHYPHLAQVKPVHVDGIGAHTTVIYQTKSLNDFELGDTKKVFVVDDVKDITEFIWAIYAEFDTDMRISNEEINDAIGVVFNTALKS
jgi:hypothetical protein